MIMDIANTLRDNLVNSKKKINPIEQMMVTSKKISEKYGDQLKSGKISINDMFNSLGRMADKIDEKTSNDEELNNLNIDENIKPDKILEDLGIDKDKFNPLDIMDNLLNKNKN